jgi:hypothetical protein
MMQGGKHMRKFTVLALLVLLFSMASAQRTWLGVSTPGLLAGHTGAALSLTPSFSLSVSGVVGFERLLGPLDLRAGGALGASGGGFGLLLGADVLYSLNPRGDSLYFGGGPQLFFSGGTASFLLQGAVGYEAFVARNWSWFAELNPLFNFSSSAFSLSAQFGINVYL